MKKVTKEQFKKEFSEARLYRRRATESASYLPCGADDAAFERLQRDLEKLVEEKPYLACLFRWD